MWVYHNLGFLLRNTHPEISCAGEVFPVLMERDRHHSVRGVESLLHSIAVVNVDIHVQHTLVVPEEWGNGQNVTTHTYTSCDKKE